MKNAEVLAPFSEVNAYLKSTIDNDVEEQAESFLKMRLRPFQKKLLLLDQLASDSAFSDTSALSADQFALENPFYAVLIPNINQNNQPNQGPVCGFAAVKDTSKINTYLSMPEVQDLLPRDLKLAWTVKPYDAEGNFVQLIALKVTSRDGKAAMSGDVVTDARTEFGQFNGSPEVSMSMSNEGGRVWKRLTGENIGKSVAIVLDNYVYSFPTVQAEISGGRSQITGNFTINEADDLANILKSGKLPAPARIIEEAIVGPSLGKEAIDAGFRSFIIALMIVLVYMIFITILQG